MDSITHVFLGAAIAQIVAGRRIGFARAFVIGAIAGNMPDLAVFLHIGDTVQDHAMHRHFMHALVMTPVLAAVACLPFLLHRSMRAEWRPLLLAAFLACLSHPLLDLLTSYGTMILWPFSPRRYALDIIAVIDPFYTVPLIAGTVLAWRWKSLRPAVAVLALSTVYLGFATLQHARALAAQRDLLASRGVSVPINRRVLPQVGAVVSYRSIYIDKGRVYADAIRVPPFGGASFKAGRSAPLVAYVDLHDPAPGAAGDFTVFRDLADGFLTRSPTDPLLLADERYTYLPETLDPVWGIQLEHTARPVFRITPRWNYFGKLLRDLVAPRGYSMIQAMPAEHG